jgi:hypothetical protein
VKLANQDKVNIWVYKYNLRRATLT